MMNKKVVLAYSGGVDTSCCIPYLIDKGYEVICFTANLGFSKKSANSIYKRAKKLGASKVYIQDLVSLFIEEYIFPSLYAGALYEDKYPLFTALSRPLIGKKLVEIAHQVEARYVAHGCTGKGNDQVRIETTVSLLDPSLNIIAPLREWHFKSRNEEVGFLKKKGIYIKETKKHPYSIDTNIWGLSIECGPLEDIDKEAPEDSYFTVRRLKDTPSKPLDLEIEFKEARPIKLNSRRMEFKDIIKKLRYLGGLYGVGRIDMIENRLVGIKSREVYETPQSVILHHCLRELEELCLDRETLHFKRRWASYYAELIYYGLWFTDLRVALDKFFSYFKRYLTGKITLRLYKGNVQVIKRESPYSLYKKSLATYGEESNFQQEYAEGFIRLWSLPFIREFKR